MPVKLSLQAAHKRHIQDYAKERPRYEAYAETLLQALQRACAVSIPEAFVQARAKTVSSYAGKLARNMERYEKPLVQMTDLCGARVIVQTLEQVQAVCQFVEANFDIVEKDEKGLNFGEDQFGYRDMHYLLRLDPDRLAALGIGKKEAATIGRRVAELQVRTWLQHAWADTFHDRIYKNPLPLSGETKRAGNLLAALMEEGDRNFNAMAHEIDGMLANYASFATKQEVKEKIEAQQLILANEPDKTKRPALALQLGRLQAACGDFKAVVKTLAPYARVKDGNQCELVQDLGYAKCKVHRNRPESAQYGQGIELLKQAIGLCCETGCPRVPHLRKREGLHGRALSRLAWALEERKPEWNARQFHHQAHEREPENPYFLADMLGFDLFFEQGAALPEAMRPTLLLAADACRRHAEAGIELPRAFFTAGRLHLLLDRPYDALGWYARGVRHCLAGVRCAPPDALARERDWVQRVNAGSPIPPAHQWVLDFLELAEMLAKKSGPDRAAPPALPPKALILAGGAGSLDKKQAAAIRPLLMEALGAFAGKAVSGGTTSGVPGLAGEVAAALKESGAKQFELIGYIPEHLPHDAEKDGRYDRLIPCGKEGFSPGQVVKTWQDLFAEGLRQNEVMCIGFGGGPLSGVEYRVALALGARVVATFDVEVLEKQVSDGEADALIRDPLWAKEPNLMPLPQDRATFCALLKPGDGGLTPETGEAMAQELHKRYVAASANRLPENMRPWGQLGETYKHANFEQAKYAKAILEACGFEVVPAADPANPALFDPDGFTDDEVKRMAEMEHGRWNVERVREGWRYGKPRDDKAKIHDKILPWTHSDLDNVRIYDREAVKKFPEILGRAGLEVRRRKVE